MTGRLLGIARHKRPKAPMETVDHAHVGLDTGIAGDFRGAIRPGKSGRRQVTMLALADWNHALALVGTPVSWEQRRANLLVDGIDLPREKGARIRIGETLTLEITGECDPCRRMEDLARGLELALKPEWRGGRTMRVVTAGDIRVGDIVTLV
jgi:MOSC domain-containing protein YiiM